MLAGTDVLGWLSRIADERSDAVAIQCGTWTMSYGELMRSISGIAATLSEVPDGEVVAVCSNNRVHMVLAMLGIMAKGCVFMPLDIWLPDARLKRLLAIASPAAFLIDSVDENRVNKVLSGYDEARVLMESLYLPPTGANCRSEEEYRVGYRDASQFNSFAPDDCCYLFHTSGSCGEPKVIAGRYKAVGHFIRWETGELAITSGIRVSQLTVPYYDAFLRDVFLPLSVGGTVCVPHFDVADVGTHALGSWIDESGVEVLHCVPSVLRVLLGAIDRAEVRRPRALRHAVVAGEPLLHSDVEMWLRVFGDSSSLINLYGPSETTMTKLFHRVSGDDLRRPSIPIGRPMSGTTVILVDQRGRPCPQGIPGEILIRTPYCSLGYRNESTLTAAAFIQNPFSDAEDDIVFKTGDMGRELPDGTIEFRGRRDLQVKVRGQRIELSEIEDALLKHPLVLDAAVVQKIDQTGTAFLVGFVVRMNERLDRQHLREYLGKLIPHSMIPGAFAFISALPRLPNGKLDRYSLSRREIVIESESELTPPCSEVERMILAIWTQFLHNAKFGTTDRFFEIGGHSLLAAQVLARVRSEFGVDLTLREFFDRPTVRGLAELVEEGLLLRVEPVELDAALKEIAMTDDPLEKDA
jgi:amino acid adenylation domain-containing protein